MKIKLSKRLNSLGLILGIIGVVMIFKWGPPQPNFDTSIGIALHDQTVIDDEGNTALDYAKSQVDKLKEYQICSRIGLGFVFLGFFVQLIATWAPKKITMFNKRKKRPKKINTPAYNIR